MKQPSMHEVDQFVFTSLDSNVTWIHQTPMKKGLRVYLFYSLPTERYYVEIKEGFSSVSDCSARGFCKAI